MAYQTEKALSRARALRKNDTEAERKLWEELRGSRLNGFKFVRQLPIGPHFVDFACRSAKLIVGIDGATHRHAREVDNDEIRTKFFGGAGMVRLLPQER